MSKAKVTFFHPREDGGGSAMSAEMHYQSDEAPGFVRIRFANQKETDFDFDNAISCDLKFDAVSQILSVLRGVQESFDDGKPIEIGGTKFAMKHLSERDAFAFAVMDGTKRSQIVLKKSEAIGLECALEHAMFFLAFIKGVNS